MTNDPYKCLRIFGPFPGARTRWRDPSLFFGPDLNPGPDSGPDLNLGNMCFNYMYDL